MLLVSFELVFLMFYFLDNWNQFFCIFFTNSQGLLCPPSYNPAEFFIQKLSVIPGEEDTSLQRLEQLFEAFRSSEQNQSLQVSMPHIQTADNSITEVK